MFNLVGFQTHLKWGEQKRVFSMIPGLENAEFIRYGVMHRNSYINSPTLLNEYFQLIEDPRFFFAGSDDRCRRLLGIGCLGPYGQAFMLVVF